MTERPGWPGQRRVAGALLAGPELAFRGLSAAFHRLYDAGVLKGRRASIPVVSVGNLTVGGTGKTPFTRWLVERLRERGHTPAILHGGYGADEPALHRAWFPDLPVIARKDRVAGAAEAAARGATVAVLDDGFQHRRLMRDVDIVLIAAEEWQATPRLLPRGPWREGLRSLRRATLVVVTRKTASSERAQYIAAEIGALSGQSVARVGLLPGAWRTLAGDEIETPPEGAVGLAAIGRPELFFENAEQAGARLSRRMSYRDHHVYDAADLARIRDAAGPIGVVTTAKDAVKLHDLGDTPVWILEQRVVVEGGADALWRALEGVAR